MKGTPIHGFPDDFRLLVPNKSTSPKSVSPSDGFSAPYMARVSSDHADESLCVEKLAPNAAAASGGRGPRLISPDEVHQHNGQEGSSFWAVIDGFVVDASDFLDSHPGGLRKLLSADEKATGATGEPFGFSFSRGRNAHFPDTGRQFQAGVKHYLSGAAGDEFLPPGEVEFPTGKIIILGRLGRNAHQSATRS